MALEPKQIIPRIYQGGWLLPEHIPELLDLGITDLLNLDLPYEDPRSFVEANLRLHTLFIRDQCLMTPQRVREILQVIESCLSSPERKVYIHCVFGASRSPTIAWLYLIHTGLSLEEATSIIIPNPLLYDAGIVRGLMDGNGKKR